MQLNRKYRSLGSWNVLEYYRVLEYYLGYKVQVHVKSKVVGWIFSVSEVDWCSMHAHVHTYRTCRSLHAWRGVVQCTGVRGTLTTYVATRHPCAADQPFTVVLVLQYTLKSIQGFQFSYSNLVCTLHSL